MFINAPTKEFTLRHLVTFSISRSRIRMKFYFVYKLKGVQGATTRACVQQIGKTRETGGSFSSFSGV